jgi:competence protein ComEC
LPSNDPRRWLGQWRQELTRRAQQVFPADEAALLTGILYGERGLSKDAKDDFRRAGLLHIIAVSGSNVTIVAVVVMSFLLGFGLSRRFAFAVFSFALIAFVLFVQPSASVVRAAIMGWLIELAPVVGRIPRTSRLLLISAAAFTLWKPWSLLFDAGFALSFLAMWGLLTWSRWLGERSRKIIRYESLREIVSSTIGATLMTVPYTIWAFGQASLYALVTSLLVLPLIPWVMAGGLIALILPFSFSSLPARGGLQFILLIARLPDAIGFGFWMNLSTSFGEMIGWYALIFMIWRLANKKKRLIHKNRADFTEKMSDEGGCQAASTFADD